MDLRPRKASLLRDLSIPIATFFGVIVSGALGYRILEPEMTVLDAVYMSVITVSTVGFREVGDLSDAGRIFTIVLVLIGFGAFGFVISSVSQHLITGALRGYLGQRRMDRSIQELSGHSIVCGYGRMGAQVVAELRRESQALVVIDRAPDCATRAAADGALVIEGDAGDDAILRRAGVDRAKALISAIDDDATNLMVALSARNLNAQLFIVARANREATESKLVMAGANRVISPFALAGKRMAQLSTRPAVVDFFELVMHDRSLELWIEEIPVGLGSQLDGATIRAVHIRETTGATIVAVRRRSGDKAVVPTPETVLAAADMIVALGTRENLARLRQMART